MPSTFEELLQTLRTLTKEKNTRTHMPFTNVLLPQIRTMVD